MNKINLVKGTRFGKWTFLEFVKHTDKNIVEFYVNVIAVLFEKLFMTVFETVHLHNVVVVHLKNVT